MSIIPSMEGHKPKRKIKIERKQPQEAFFEYKEELYSLMREISSMKVKISLITRERDLIRLDNSLLRKRFLQMEEEHGKEVEKFSKLGKQMEVFLNNMNSPVPPYTAS